MRIILASASPRRRELLEQIGLSFEILPSHVEENAKAKTPEKLVEFLSAQKAEAVFAAVSEEESVLVIGADTVVARKGNILGKPKDKKAAVKMLKQLAGKAHHVYTGVTLIYRPERAEKPCQVRKKTFHEATKVRFYPMTREEIQAYVATGEPLDKAGAYGIQGVFARYVERLEGDYSNVVGLPVGRLYQELKQWLDPGQLPAASGGETNPAAEEREGCHEGI